MNKTSLPIVILIALLASSYAIYADDLSTRIQNAYGKINSFEADFTQTLTHKESGSVEKRNGTIQFQKPLRIRWETKKPNAETLVINSREIWDYIPEEQIAYRYNPVLVQDSRSIIQVITGQARLEKDFNIKRHPGENGLVKLELLPKDPTTDMVEAAIWVDPASGIIQRASVTDFYGNINDIAFNSFKPGARIQDKRFSFSPPKGVDVEDLMDREIQERKLFQ